MDSFKQAAAKLEILRETGYISEQDYETRKKALVDEYIGQQNGESKPAGESKAYLPLKKPIRGPCYCVKVRGVPFNATDGDVIAFFSGFSLYLDDPVRFQMNAEGRPTGVTFVRFKNAQEATRALTRDRQYIGSRYVEVFSSTLDEMNNSLKPVATTSWVKIRGMPYTATKSDIRAFFKDFPLEEQNINIVTGNGGRATGECYIQFNDEYDAQRAVLKDKEQIGNRFVEIFLSSQDDCDSAFANASSAGYLMGSQGPVFGGPIRFQSEYIIRMRGLPFRSSEADIEQFFAGLDVNNVQIAYLNGKATGEAFVEFKNETSFEAGIKRDKGMLGSRYVELFRSNKAEAASRQTAPTQAITGPPGNFGPPMGGPPPGFGPPMGGPPPGGFGPPMGGPPPGGFGPPMGGPGGFGPPMGGPGGFGPPMGGPGGFGPPRGPGFGGYGF